MVLRLLVEHSVHFVKPGAGLFAFVAMPDAVIEVAVADGAKALVVEDGDAEGEKQLLLEAGERLQVGGGDGDLGIGGFEELLVAAVDEARELAADNLAGLEGELGGTAGGGVEDGGASVFADQKPSRLHGGEVKLEAGKLLPDCFQ